MGSAKRKKPRRDGSLSRERDGIAMSHAEPEKSAAEFIRKNIKPRKYITLEEKDALLKVINDQEHLIITRLLLNGMRVSEVVGLIYYDTKRARRLGKERYDGIRVKDIDFENRIIAIFGKGEKQRSVTIDKGTIALLKIYIELGKIQGRVFRMSVRNVQWFLKKYGEKAGIENLHPHKLRHSWSTFAFRKNVANKFVTDQMGHDDPAFTAEVYDHIDPYARQRDVDTKMGDWLS